MVNRFSETIFWLRRRMSDFDLSLIVCLLGISFFCISAIYSTTINRVGKETIYKTQLVWEVISYLSMLAFTVFNYRNLKGILSWIGYAVSIFLLIIVFAFPAKNGAHAWITLPGFQFQPSEIAKIFLILTISDFMERSKEKDEKFTFKHAGVIFSIFIGPFILVLMEPHLGQALVMLGIVSAMLVLFLEKKQLIVFLSVAGSIVLGIFLVKVIYPDQFIRLVDSAPFMNHQKIRIITFIDPQVDPKGIGYQVTQGIIAVGSGGLFGKGLLSGTQTQGAWIPEQWTDFIFSAIAEEFGFVGSSIVLFLFFSILYRMTRIAQTAPDYFSSYYITGIIGMFSFQVIENVGMNLAIMPVTGITLPFISYGGTSLLTNFILVGIVLSAGIRRKSLVF